MNASTHPLPSTTARSSGLLGDTAERDYTLKLRLFNAFAAPELRQAIAGLDIRPGMHILDAGCGSGEALGWLSHHAGPAGQLVGIDLATAHLEAARSCAPAHALLMQADLMHAPLPPSSFDLIWCVNTLNHLREPLEALQALLRLLRPGGRIALGQSALLPEMYLAWDARLERLTNEAVRQYYRERYRVDERELTAIRALAGLLRRAGLEQVSTQTVVIERLAPVDSATERYLTQAIFRDTWGERLQPYLAAEDYAELTRLCDPQDAAFALRRPDFHFLQSFTLAVGSMQPGT
jgi:ubiquinone/menaquinone biosynthesis C-methylase UbiE